MSVLVDLVTPVVGCGNSKFFQSQSSVVNDVYKLLMAANTFWRVTLQLCISLWLTTCYLNSSTDKKCTKYPVVCYWFCSFLVNKAANSMMLISVTNAFYFFWLLHSKSHPMVQQLNCVHVKQQKKCWVSNHSNF